MTDYTIARYEYNIGGGEAHDFYALERLNSDGSSTRLAAMHGMATDAQDRPRPIGMPWDDDTIKAHLYTDQDRRHWD